MLYVHKNSCHERIMYQRFSEQYCLSFAKVRFCPLELLLDKLGNECSFKGRVHLKSSHFLAVLPTYLPLHDIPFWKSHTKDNAMVTSAADLGDRQTKPNQIMHIYPYMIYLFEKTRPRTLQWWPLQLIWVTSKPN